MTVGRISNKIIQYFCKVLFSYPFIVFLKAILTVSIRLEEPEKIALLLYFRSFDRDLKFTLESMRRVICKDVVLLDTNTIQYGCRLILLLELRLIDTMALNICLQALTRKETVVLRYIQNSVHVYKHSHYYNSYTRIL